MTQLSVYHNIYNPKAMATYEREVMHQKHFLPYRTVNLVKAGYTMVDLELYCIYFIRSLSYHTGQLSVYHNIYNPETMATYEREVIPQKPSLPYRTTSLVEARYTMAYLKDVMYLSTCVWSNTIFASSQMKH